MKESTEKVRTDIVEEHMHVKHKATVYLVCVHETYCHLRQ